MISLKININNIEDLRKAHPLLNITWEQWCGEEPYIKDTYTISERITSGGRLARILSSVPLDVWFCNTCKVITLKDGTPFRCDLLKISGDYFVSIVYDQIYWEYYGNNNYSRRTLIEDILYTTELRKIYKLCKVRPGDSKIFRLVKEYVRENTLKGRSQNTIEHITM